MNKLELHTRTDDSGSLQIRLPGRQAAYAVRITIEWDDAGSATAGWPDGWLDALAGAIDDSSFVRHPQGEFDVRESFG